MPSWITQKEGAGSALPDGEFQFCTFKKKTNNSGGIWVIILLIHLVVWLVDSVWMFLLLALWWWCDWSFSVSWRLSLRHVLHFLNLPPLRSYPEGGREQDNWQPALKGRGGSRLKESVKPLLRDGVTHSVYFIKIRPKFLVFTDSLLHEQDVYGSPHLQMGRIFLCVGVTHHVFLSGSIWLFPDSICLHTLIRKATTIDAFCSV